MGLEDKGKRRRSEAERGRERVKGKEGQVKSERRADAVPWSNTNTRHVLVNWKLRFARRLATPPLSTHMADCKQRASFFVFW